MGAPTNKVVDLFQDPISHFGAPGSHFGLSKWLGDPWVLQGCGVADSKRVPPSLAKSKMDARGPPNGLGSGKVSTPRFLGVLSNFR